MTPISATDAEVNTPFTDRHSSVVEADLIWGAQAIAEFLRHECGIATMTRAKAYQWAARKKIPAGKLGGLLFASRSGIKKHLAEKLGAATGPLPSARLKRR
jgi:hypothetical protein